MTLIDAIILGLIQGLTEFLPVSSSGHLVLGKELLRISHAGDISFEVFVHFGTFLSVVVALRKDVKAIIMSFFNFLKNPGQFISLYRSDEYFRLIVLILLGSIPAAVLGLTFEREIEVLFDDPKLVSVMLMITAFILFLTRFANPPEKSDARLGSALLVGLAQAFAIVPGISRSGSTISVGMIAGISRPLAARFSFLLALPVIFGAAVLKVNHLVASPPPVATLLTLAAGTITAAISGYIAIVFLMGVIRKGRFSWFSYYCFVVGILGVLFIG